MTDLMCDEALGFHKIGRSKRPEYRERTLQAEKPSIHLVYFQQAPAQFENWLHKVFEVHRLRGEWFDLSSPDVEAVCSGAMYTRWLRSGQ